MKPIQFVLTALVSLIIGIGLGSLFTGAIWEGREASDFRATAVALNKQIKTELPRMCAELEAKDRK